MHEKFRIGKFPGIQGSYEMDSYAPGSSYRRLYCPSRFMADKMVQGNFDKQKINTLCNFIDIAKTRKDDYDKENYYCYIGRLSPEKGSEH